MPHRPLPRASLLRPLLVLALLVAGSAAAWGAAAGDFVNLFSSGGSTGQALYQASAVILGDGRVLVLGGTTLSPQGGSSASVASCAIYDPVGGSWSATGSLITARRECGACLLANGQVMVAGGIDVGSTATVVLAQAEVYSPASGSWSALPALPVGLMNVSLMVLPSGDVLALGTPAGAPVAGAIYSVGSGSWSVIAPTPVPRTACAFALLPSGLVLVAGGNLLSGAPGATVSTPTTSCVLYDPVAGAWSATGALLANHLSCHCLVLPSGAVLIGAGSGGSGAYGGTGAADSELYAGGSWTATGQLPYQAVSAQICLLSSGDVLSAGGSSGNYLTSAARYSSASGTWSAPFAMAASHYQGALAALPSDQAVIAEGWDEIAGAEGSVNYLSDGSSEIYQDALINTAPSFTAGPDQQVLENSGAHAIAGWATAISPGLPAESAQTVSFVVVATNPGLFSSLPAVDASGTLSYALAANAYGAATVTIQAHDDGGTAHGGQDTSAAQTVTITAAFVNVPPTFAIGANQTALRTAGAQRVNGFLTAVSPGPADESSLSVQVALTNSANQLFAAQPAIDAQGNLSYTPGDSAGGVATVAVTVTNSGGTANGGVASTTQTFTITIIPVNHVPLFTIGAALASPEDSGPVAIPAWATGISPGTFDVGQTVAFTVTCASPALFAVQPQIDPSGTLTFTPAANAIGSALITVTLQDDGGTANGGIDTSAPQTATISLTSVPTLTIAPSAVATDASPIIFTFTFSEAVNGFGAASITVANGSVGAFSGAGSSYSCAVTPLADGPLTVSVAANACTSVADGNGNAAASASVTSERTAPTVVIAPNGSATNAASVLFTFTFSKPVIGFTAGSVQLINGSPGVFLGSGANYSLSVSPQAVGTVFVSVPAGSCSDAVGNGVIASVASIAFDNTSPTAVIAPTGGSTNSAPIPFAITFDKPVSGLTASAFSASNGTIGELSGSGASYSLPVTPTRQGAIGLALKAGAASDAFGNLSAAASASETYSTSAPTLLIAPDGTRTNVGSILFSFTFSEPVVGFLSSSVAVTNGVAGTFTGSGSVYTLVVTPLAQGAVQVAVPAGAGSDAAGNGNLAAAASVIYDTVPPALTISPSAITTNAVPIIFTITASKSITGLSAGSFSCANGTLGLLSGSGSAFTLPVTPLGNGTVTLQLPADSVSDLAGNGNAAVSDSVISDTTAPTIAITPAGGSSDASPLVFSITFSTAVSGFTASSVTLGNGTLGALSGSGASYSLSVVPAAQGAVTVSIAAGAGTDAAGNPSAAASASETYDLTRPTLAITPTASATDHAPILFTFTFSQAVTGFTSADITLGNGSAGAFSGAGTAYTLAVTPAAQGAVTVAVGDSVAHDAAGNGNTAASASVIYDTTPPVLVITPNGATTNASPIIVSFAFSEPVAGFTQQSITLTGASALAFAGSGANYTLAVTPDGDGLIAVAVAAGACSDLAGNANAASSATFTSRRTPPGCTIAPNGGSTAAPAITFTLTFTTTVVGLAGSALELSNGTLTGFAGTGSIYTATVAPLGDGAVVVSLPANSCTDVVGNGNLAASAAVTSDRTRPALALSSPRALTNSAPITFDVLFSKPVTGFDSSKIALTDGTITAFSGSGASYAITVIPLAEGAVTAAVSAGAAVDVDGNGSLAASCTVTYAVTPPALTITPSGTATNANAVAVTFTFSEAVSGFTAQAVSVSNGVKDQLSGSGAVFTMIIAAVADGPITIAVADGACADLAGNPCIGATAIITSDRTPPSAVLSPNGIATNASPIALTIVFSEPVLGFTVAGLSAANGTLSGFTGSGASYGVLATPNAAGQLSVMLRAGACSDAVGNPNLAASATVTYDTTPPTALIHAAGNATAAGTITDASPITFSIVWDTNVSGLSTGALLAINGTVGTLSGSGSTYALTVTPLADGVVTVTIPAGTVADAAGNLNALAVSASVTSDRTPPTVTITPAGISTNHTPTLLSLVFSEPVTGFTAAGVSVSNGSCGALSGSGTSYQLPIFPTANGTVGITVVHGAGLDAAGNLSLPATASFTYDTVHPACTITPTGMVTNADIIPLTVTFSAPVTGFSASAVTVVNGSVGAITSAASGGGPSSTYTVPIAPSSDGLVSVTIASGAGVDAAGNPSTPASASFTSIRTPPTLTITPNGTTTNASPITVTFAFSEPPVGFGPDSITLSNATPGAFAGSGTLFTLAISPIADGAVGIAVATDAVSDAAGNGNIGASATITSARTPPTPLITPNGGATNAAPISFTFTFPAAVTGFSAAALQLVNGSAGTLSGAGAVYSVPVTPGVQGLVSVTLPAGAVVDAYGNANLAASASTTYDTTPPTLAISPNAQLLTTPTILFTFTFSELVSGFSAGAITVSNGTPGAFSGAGASYSLVVTPLADGPVAVTVGVGAAVDAAGNGSTAASASVISARTAPSVTISGPTGPTDADPIIVTYQWSSAVTGFSTSGIQVSNGSAGALSGSGAVYTQAITPAADGPVVVTVLAGAGVNAAGTGNAPATATFMSDRTPPTVVITPTGTTTNASPITLTLTFSEPVFNLSAAAIGIANGTAGTLTGSGALYTLAVTPLVDGAVVVTLPAGSCTDVAGNGNPAASATITSERSAPLPTISPNGGRALQSPLPFTVSWSKPVMNFTQADLVVTNGTVASFSGAGASYQALVVPAGLGQLTVAIPAGVCTDVVGNLNGPAQATVTYAPPTQPVITLPSGSVIYQRGSSPVAIDGAAGISDQNGLPSYDGGTLGAVVTANGEASDLIAIIPGTYGDWVVGVSGQTVTVAPGAGGPATTVALASGGANGVAYQLTLAGGATPAVTISLLRSLGFSTGDVVNQKATVVKTLAVTFQDGSGVAPAGATKPITVIPVFPPPLAASATVDTLENQAYSGSLATLWTDQGVAAPTVTYALVGSPQGGTMTAFDPVSGAFTFLPAVDAVAPGSFSYEVTDQYNASAPATITVAIGAVTQPPQWTPGLDVTVAEDSPPYTGVGWASGISPGPANQSGQTVSFALVASQPALFSVQPALSPGGTLSFTPAPGSFGQSQVTAILSNSGGTANGGQDTAAPVVFTITVSQVIQAPAALTLTLHTVLGVAVSGQIVLSDPDHQLPPGPASYLLTGISQLGPLTVSASGLVTFTPTQPGSQQVPYMVTVAGADYPGVIQLFDNALVPGRPLVASMPDREQGAGGTPWSYALTVDPLSIAAGDDLSVSVQSGDAALNAAVITPASGNQFVITVPALDPGGGPLQSLIVIVTDMTTGQSDYQTLFLVVTPPGGST